MQAAAEAAALAMQRGLAALKHFDRPGSLEAAERHFSALLAGDGGHAAAAAGMARLACAASMIEFMACPGRCGPCGPT